MEVLEHTLASVLDEAGYGIVSIDDDFAADLRIVVVDPTNGTILDGAIRRTLRITRQAVAEFGWPEAARRALEAA